MVYASHREGKMREGVWLDSTGRLFGTILLSSTITSARKVMVGVLGYDSAHGFHHRHWMGMVEAIEFPGYEELATRFSKEVAELCKKGKA